MSVDYRDEINRLLRLQKQQNYIKDNKDMLYLSPLNKNSQQIAINMIQQNISSSANPQPNKVNFLLQGNGSKKYLTEDYSFQPKGNRPLVKIQAPKKGNNNLSLHSAVISQNDSPVKMKQNISQLLDQYKLSLQSTNYHSPIKTKMKQSMNAINLSAPQNRYKNGNQIQIEDQGEQTMQNNSQEYSQEQDKQQQQQQISTIADYANQTNEYDQQEQRDRYYNPRNQVRCKSQSRVYAIREESENKETIENLKQYGVGEVIIKGGGGGMIKGKKKYDYRFRDVNELIEESENTAPFGLVEMRQTPRLYEKKMKLQTINDWKNERLISCEEDILAKHDIDLANKFNKQRLQQQIDVISRQQFEWEHIVSHQLQRHRVKQSNISAKAEGSRGGRRDISQLDQTNTLFQQDFDKRIHNLYINEKLLKFSAEKQSAEDKSKIHSIYLQKEKERIREQDMQSIRQKKQKKYTSQLNTFNYSDAHSPERIDIGYQYETNQLLNNSNEKLNKLRETFTKTNQYHTSQGDLSNEGDKQKYKNIQQMNEMMQLKHDLNQQQTTDDVLKHIMSQSYQSSQKKNNDRSPSPNDQINKLYTYYDYIEKSKETVNDNYTNNRAYCTTGDIVNDKENLETYLQKEIITQTRTKLPSIEKTPIFTQRQPIPFSLSEQKPKQFQIELTPIRSFSKKLSVDSSIMNRNKARNLNRNVSPSIHYNVQIPNQDKNKRNYSLGSSSQTKYKQSSKKGFLNQTFIYN